MILELWQDYADLAGADETCAAAVDCLHEVAKALELDRLEHDGRLPA